MGPGFTYTLRSAQMFTVFIQNVANQYQTFISDITTEYVRESFCSKFKLDYRKPMLLFKKIIQEIVLPQMNCQEEECISIFIDQPLSLPDCVHKASHDA